MALLLHRKCSACGTKYDLLKQGDEVLGMDRDDDLPVCPTCDSADCTKIVQVPTGVELGGGASTGKLYPYYDNALDCHVESAAHRRRICKERGLVPVDGDMQHSMDDYFRRARAEHDRVERFMADERDRHENSPEFRDFRRARDRGVFGRG